MHKLFLKTGAVAGLLAVMLGAFGAHKLKELIPAESVASFQTGVQYQMYHGIALLLTGILYEKFAVKQMRLAGWFFIAGIILFSGSLYIMALLKMNNGIGVSGIGIITPFGGLCFIAGWLFILQSFSIKN